MSEKKLQNLAKEFPALSGVFEAVLEWFKNHPYTNAISMEIFYSNKFSFTREEINIAFILMQEKLILTTIYRILDEDGSKIGIDFEDFNEIPDTVDTMWGEKKDTRDVLIVPYYKLLK